MFSMRLLLVALLLVAALARGEETASRPERTHGHPHITVRLWPRSHWDPEHTYMPARVVATMGVRICERVTGNGECAEHRDAWSTVVSRDDYLYPRVDRLQETLDRVYHFADLGEPHLCELYRTYDNLTYVEIPLELDEHLVMHGRIAPLHPEDDALIRKARVHAQLNREARIVLRLERGRLWQIPEAHWTMGERGLNGATGFLKTEWIGEGESDGNGHPNDETTNTDERPVYYESQ